VLAAELLAERALGGDGHARRQLVDDVYLPLLHARGALVETLTAWLDRGSSIEGAARALFVHPNTVRYRLRQVADLTGLTPSQPRDAFTLQIALVLGRQASRSSRGTSDDRGLAQVEQASRLGDEVATERRDHHSRGA
jgi:DNA-binding PucR family transcriptional regulator